MSKPFGENALKYVAAKKELEVQIRKFSVNQFCRLLLNLKIAEQKKVIQTVNTEIAKTKSWENKDSIMKILWFS